MDKDFEAVILSACRTPIGAFGGALKGVSAADLGAIVVREALSRAGAKAEDVGDVVLGCVLQAGNGMNVARQAALKAGLPVETPGETVNRVCGSGLQAVVHADGAQAGASRVGVARQQVQQDSGIQAAAEADQRATTIVTPDHVGQRRVHRRQDVVSYAP